MFPELIVLVGPTAVGKSHVALALAGRMEVEIISADSVQVYRYLDIGSAKPSPAERRRVPHHLIDVVDPDEPFDVVRYRELARRAVAEIHARGRVPLVVGGTGFYVRALLREGELPPAGADPQVRRRLEQEAERRGLGSLFARLQEVDPVTAADIDPRNPRRLVRALEVYETTGRPRSSFRGLAKDAPLRYNAIFFGLSRPRDILFRRIDQRVDRMLVAGFDDEVRGLLARGYSPALPALQSLGYKHWLPAVGGQRTQAEAVALWKRDTRRYARRQQTWFRAEREIEWFTVPVDETAETVADRLLTRLAEASRPRGGEQEK